MKILAADTTTPFNTVAVCEDDCVLAESLVHCGRAHSERLLATVDWVLAEAGLTLSQVDALAISIGPGSFTGVRVGAATWKGLALGAGLPLAAVPTLDAMTRLVPFVDATVCPMLDAKMGEVFGAVYRFTGGLRTKLVPETVCTAENLAAGTTGVAFLGDGAARYRGAIEQVSRDAEFIPAWLGAPRASAVAIEAMALIAQGISTDPANAVPVYLRKSQAELNRAKAQTP